MSVHGGKADLAVAPRQLRLLAGQEHGRTIPLPDMLSYMP